MDAPSWMDKEFVEDILKKSERDTTIRVTEIDVKPATMAGENFLTVVYRIRVKIIRDNKSDEVSLIAKTMPPTVYQFNQGLKYSGIFERETHTIKNTLMKINKLLGPGERLSPRHVFTCLKKPVLIMEDLAPLGFRMANREKRLDLTHSLLAIRNLAKFHAGSVALCEQEPEHSKHNAQNALYENNPETGAMIIGAVAKLGKAIADWPEFDERYSQKLLQFAPHSVDKVSEATKVDENSFHVITHGDYWINNMLFRYDHSGQPIEHLIIDFQMSTWGSPALDLQYFMNTSLSEDVDLDHRDRLLKEYKRSLMITMKRLGCKTPTPTLQELETAMRRLEIIGMMATFMVMPMIMTKKSEALDLDELFRNEHNPALQNQLYRQVLLRRLSEFEKHGLLDV